MRRKDGKTKRKPLRSLPVFKYGFRDNPTTESYRHSTLNGEHASENHKVVSLFSGCGGLDLGVLGGFEYLGKRYVPLPFEIIHAVDNSQDAIDAYHLNLGSHAILSDLTTEKIERIPKAEILMGGFPCQDFSSSGPKVGLNGKRGNLYQVLTEYMTHHRPKIVLGENVPHLARLRRGEYLSTIIHDFESVGYRFDVWDLYAPDYGLPQSRRRLFMIGVRDDIKGFPYKPSKTHEGKHVPIEDGIGDLVGVKNESVTNQSQYFVATKATAGGGQGDHTNRIGSVGYCIRANARGRIQFHYKLQRRLTVRECARLQSFPDEFIFPYSTQRNMTLIGNAVPPILGYSVAKSLEVFLKNTNKSYTGSDMRTYVSDFRDHQQQLTLL